jgi:hypothetical protein
LRFLDNDIGDVEPALRLRPLPVKLSLKVLVVGHQLRDVDDAQRLDQGHARERAGRGIAFLVAFQISGLHADAMIDIENRAVGPFRQQHAGLAAGEFGDVGEDVAPAPGIQGSVIDAADDVAQGCVFALILDRIQRRGNLTGCRHRLSPNVQ